MEKISVLTEYDEQLREEAAAYIPPVIPEEQVEFWAITLQNRFGVTIHRAKFNYPMYEENPERRYITFTGETVFLRGIAPDSLPSREPDGITGFNEPVWIVSEPEMREYVKKNGEAGKHDQ